MRPSWGRVGTKNVQGVPPWGELEDARLHAELQEGGGWHTERSGDLSAMLRCSNGDDGGQGGESAGQVWEGLARAVCMGNPLV